MAYKDILLYLEPSDCAEDRLKLAVSLAGTHGARLIGVDVSSNEALLGPIADRTLAIRKNFLAAARGGDVDAEFVAQDDVRAAPLSDWARCADLLIAPRPETEAKGLMRSLVPDQALLESGAPMLVLPGGWKYRPVGVNVVIAWNASREAARATRDAMPFLKLASKVTIFCFASRPDGLRASADHLADHLSRHGVTSQISGWTDTGDATALEALFASVDTQDADLLVAGAFGHSRVFESLFGGVSLDLLRQPVLPVLMSH